MAALNLIRPFEAYSGFRFGVTVEGISFAAFMEFRLPSFQLETEDLKEGGQNAYVHKLPVRVTVGNATLRHGIGHDLSLLTWYLDVIKGDIAKAKRTVTVTMHGYKSGGSREDLFSWTFSKAYPVKWTGPTLKADDNTVGIEEIEFVHQGFVVSSGDKSSLIEIQ